MKRIAKEKLLSLAPLSLAKIAALLILTTSLPAFSQNCALCYTQAASSGARMIAQWDSNTDRSPHAYVSGHDFHCLSQTQPIQAGGGFP